MTLFKVADEKLKKLGFEKTVDNGFTVQYVRKVKDVNYGANDEYEQSVVLVSLGTVITNRYRNRHMIRSNGLTVEELKLFIRKMKEKGWK